MSAYEGFSLVYDQLMDNVPYDTWCAWVERMLARYGITGGLVLDLGCGTGEVTKRLCHAGFDMIGADSSALMLSAAREKAAAGGDDILYLQQDMRCFELYGTVQAVVSICDTLNYLLEEEELLQVFRLVNNYLDPGGIFLFDMNTEQTFREEGDNVFAENREDCSFIWENTWYEEEKINQIDLTLFLREADGRYRRETETHLQRAYDRERVAALLEEAGLEVLAVLEDYTEKEAEPTSRRICFAAREMQKAHTIRDQFVTNIS